MNDVLRWSLLIVGAYLLGSVPFAYILGRLRGIDIREHGSRNVGASNVGRVLGRPMGMFCFVLDVCKGLIPTLMAGLTGGLLHEWFDSADQAITTMQMLLWVLVGASAIIGHTNSVFLGFQGGKGVATACGAMLGIYPFLTMPVAIAVVIWLVVLGIFRMISLASMLACVSIPLSFLLTLAIFDPSEGESNFVEKALGHWPFFGITALLAAFVVWKHRSNIHRIMAGTEARIGQAKQSYEQPDRPQSADI